MAQFFESLQSFQSLKLRALSALVLIVVSLWVVYHGGWLFLAFCALFAGAALVEWFRLARQIPGNGSYLIGGPVYILMAFSYCVMIRMGFPWPVSFVFLALVWSSDIGAYFAGKFIGGAKMASEISPNKTWAGFVGAVGFPGALYPLSLMAAAAHHEGVGFSALEYGLAAICGMLLGLTGQAGDLIVSYCKRKAGVKDTGSIIPGHGGVLDRIDSMMLCAPVFYVIMGYFFHG